AGSRLGTVGRAIEMIDAQQDERMVQLTARGGAFERKWTGRHDCRNFTVAAGRGHEVVLTAIIRPERADSDKVPSFVKAHIPNRVNAVGDKTGHFDDDMRAFVDALGRSPAAGL